MLRLWLAVSAVIVTTRSSHANKGYFIMAPSRFRSGVQESLSVTILDPSSPVHVTARLYDKVGRLVSQASADIRGRGILKMPIPAGVWGRTNLKICGNCQLSRQGAFTFHNSTFIVIEEKGTSVFLQTDRPVYKPGQKVHVNVFMTGPDLKPSSQPLLFYVLDPRQTRIIQREDLKPTCCGVVKTSFPISSQPVLGTWTVFARVNGNLCNRTLMVQKFVPVKFEVIVSPPKYITDWDKCQHVYIKARYLYGKPMEGNLTISVNVRGLGYYKDFTSLTNTSVIKIKGETIFNVCISHMMGVETQDHFNGVLDIVATVTSSDASSVVIRDRSCIVNKHLIGLEFPSDMRKYFKPDLPFKGKLLVFYPDGSPADNVTVRIRAESRGKTVYTQQYVSVKGIVMFGIPSIPDTFQYVWIEAQVIKINDEVVENKYLPTFISISSWYSPSKCHLVIENGNNDIKVSDVAMFKIIGNCEGDFTLYHEVIARGNIENSGIHRYSNKMNTGIRNKQAAGDGVHIRIKITHQMAKSSRLLVYYIRENGEVVADTITFNVKPVFENKVSLDVTKREVHPGDWMKVHVQTTSDACVCVGAVDRSAVLMHPGYQLSIDEIFEELASYEIQSRHEDGGSWRDFWRNNRHHRRRRSNVWWDVERPKDAAYAFQAAGMLVLTDTVWMNRQAETPLMKPPFFRRPGRGYLALGSYSSTRQELKELHKSLQRSRSYFPYTWFWECLDSIDLSKARYISRQIPDSITEWQLFAVSMSKRTGLALSESLHVSAAKKFFLGFTLPYSVIRGEEIQIHINVHNYLASCARVKVTFNLPTDVQAVSLSDNTYELYVNGDDVSTFKVTFLFATVGKLRITVEARAYLDDSHCNGLSTESLHRQHLIGFDNVTKTIISEAEGIPSGYTESLYFCLNERVHLSSSESYEFQYLRLPLTPAALNFSVKAARDVHVALSVLAQDNTDMYEVVLGGFSNTHSWVSYGKQGARLVHAETPGILSDHVFRNFSIMWEAGVIKVSSIDQRGAIIMQRNINHSLHFRYVGFSTGYNTAGDFLIWNKDDSSTNIRNGELFSLNLPKNYVPGSESAQVTIIGDVMGPVLYSLGHLTDLPSGCGEQNMVHFAPVVSILTYQKRTGQMTSESQERGVQRLLEGYQRQLTYKRFDGSYSAFGQQDFSGSTWLTAFVVKSFSQARKLIYIDPQEIEWCKEWIIAHQNHDGSFPSIGKLINKNIKGGVNGEIALTSYVLMALVEAGTTSTTERDALDMGMRFLERRLHVLRDAYTVAMTSHALNLLGSDYVLPAVEMLNNLAVRQGDIVYWSGNSDLHRNDIFYLDDTPEINEVTSGQVETAAYALLTYIGLGDVTSALPIVRWLTRQRNVLGGFVSTQDTCVALQALAEFAALSYTDSTNLVVSMATTNFDLQKTLHVNNQSDVRPHAVAVPSLPAQLFVEASGEGCALFQVNVKYNIPTQTRKPYFHVYIKLTRSAQHARRKRHALTRDNDDVIGQITLEPCIRWAGAGSSNMTLLEVNLLTGYVADDVSIQRILDDPMSKVKRYEIDGRRVLFYFDEIPSECVTCIRFQVEALYTVAGVRAVPVSVYDYYQPSYSGSVVYNMSDILDEARCSGNDCFQRTTSAVFHEADVKKCTCFRDCPPGGDQVCGSDGVVYQNQCYLEVEACQRDAVIETKPIDVCTQGVGGSPSGDGSGEDYFSGDLLTTWSEESLDLMNNNPEMEPASRDEYDYIYDNDDQVVTGFTSAADESPMSVNGGGYLKTVHDDVITEVGDSHKKSVMDDVITEVSDPGEQSVTDEGFIDLGAEMQRQDVPLGMVGQVSQIALKALNATDLPSVHGLIDADVLNDASELNDSDIEALDAPIDADGSTHTSEKHIEKSSPLVSDTIADAAARTTKPTPPSLVSGNTEPSTPIGNLKISRDEQETSTNARLQEDIQSQHDKSSKSNDVFNTDGDHGYPEIKKAVQDAKMDADRLMTKMKTDKESDIG